MRKSVQMLHKAVNGDFLVRNGGNVAIRMVKLFQTDNLESILRPFAGMSKERRVERVDNKTLMRFVKSRYVTELFIPKLGDYFEVQNYLQKGQSLVENNSKSLEQFHLDMGRFRNSFVAVLQVEITGVGCGLPMRF